MPPKWGEPQKQVPLLHPSPEVTTWKSFRCQGVQKSMLQVEVGAAAFFLLLLSDCGSGQAIRPLFPSCGSLKGRPLLDQLPALIAFSFSPSPA